MEIRYRLLERGFQILDEVNDICYLKGVLSDEPSSTSESFIK
jgi:hypothetical protein